MFYSKWKKISSQAKGRGKESLRFSFVPIAPCLPYWGPTTRIPPMGLAQRQDPVALVAYQELPVLWKCWRQVDMRLQQCFWGLRVSPPLDPRGSFPAMAERNPKMWLEAAKVPHSHGDVTLLPPPTSFPLSLEPSPITFPHLCLHLWQLLFSTFTPMNCGC